MRTSPLSLTRMTLSGSPMIMIRSLSVCVVIALCASSAFAKTIEPGAMYISGGIGPGVKMESSLPASAAYMMINGGFEYAFTPVISAITDLAIGAAGTVPFTLRTGVRARLSGLRSPFSPYTQLQWVGGVTFNVADRHPFTTGARLGVGADYFLSKNLAVGCVWAFNLLYAAGATDAFYGTVEWIFLVAYRFDGL